MLEKAALLSKVTPTNDNNIMMIMITMSKRERASDVHDSDWDGD